MQINRVEGYNNRNNKTSFGTKLNIINSNAFKLPSVELRQIENTFEHQTSKFSGSIELENKHTLDGFTNLQFVYRNDKHKDVLEGIMPESKISVNLLQTIKQIHKVFRNREKNIARIQKNISTYYAQTGEDISKINNFTLYDMLTIKDIMR